MGLFERMRARKQKRDLEDFLDMAEAAGETKVAERLKLASAVGFSPISILIVLAPFLIGILTGQPIDWAAVLAALEKLINS